jgi:hypothetical protein
MEYFTRKLYDLRSECEEYIRTEMKKLGEGNVQLMLCPQEAVDDMDTDVLMDLPVQLWEGKHSYLYRYYMYKIEMNKDLGLWFHGVESEEGDNYVFGINELDASIVIEIASHLQYLNDQANG